ncbi:MAG: adenylyltransferase/cytidyltransferase family protein, partial [bacterium]|nr:adenylyltransferase/cytidyltransferase family protein [bacterium]
MMPQTHQLPLRIALYPGSFDPITNGHLDIVERALRLFDVVHIGIGQNRTKTGLFTVEERRGLIEQALDSSGVDRGRAPVMAFSGLVTAAAQSLRAAAIVR